MGIALENTLDPLLRLFGTVALLEEKGVMGGGFRIEFFFEDSFVTIYCFIYFVSFLERSGEVEKPSRKIGVEIDHATKPETGFLPVAPIRGCNPEGKDNLSRSRESLERLAEVGFGFSRASLGHEHEPEGFEDRRCRAQGLEKRPRSVFGPFVISLVVKRNHGTESRKSGPGKHRGFPLASPGASLTAQRSLTPILLEHSFGRRPLTSPGPL
jgi:hypothetical protein